MKPSIRISMAVTAALLLAVFAATAGAATLMLEGPRGMRVHLDGVDLGVLPLRSLEVELGEHELVGVLSGAEKLNTAFTVDDENEIVTLRLRPLPLSRKEAALSSLAFAGLGQRYVGRSTMGWVLSGAEAVGLITAIVSNLDAQNSRDDYHLAWDEYRNALTADDVEAWRNTAEGHYDDWQSSIDRRKAGLLLAAGAVAVSVLDAVFRFPALDAGVNLGTVGPQPDAMSSVTSSPSIHLALRLGF